MRSGAAQVPHAPQERVVKRAACPPASTAGLPPDSGVKMSLIMVKKNSTPLQVPKREKTENCDCQLLRVAASC